MKKRVLTLLLAMAMVVMTTACALGGDNSSDTAGTDSTDATISDSVDGSNGENSGDGENTDHSQTQDVSNSGNGNTNTNSKTGNNNTSSNGKTNNTSSNKTNTQSEPSIDSGKLPPATIKVWIQTANQPQFFTWVKKQFEKENPNIKLKIEPQASATFGPTLDNVLNSSKAPDVSATWGGLVVPRLVAGKRVLNLDDVISGKESKMLDAVKYNKVKNQWYCAPLNGFASPVVFYNKTAFDKNGWSVPETYAELKTLSQNIRNKGKQPLISGLGDWPMSHFMQAMHARTMPAADFNKLLTPAKGSNPFNHNGITDGFALLQKYQNDKIFANNITGYNANAALGEFVNQSAYMYAAPSLELLTINDSASFEIGAFFLPKSPEHPNNPESLASGVYSDVFVVNSKTKYPQHCKKLIEFLMSDKVQAKLLDYYLFPVYKKVDTSGISPQVKPTFEAVLKPILNTINTQGVTGFYQNYTVAQMDGRLASLAVQVANGKLSPADAKANLAKFYADNTAS